MRVTNLMLYQKSGDQAARQLERLADLQDQLSTGKRLRQPSDDPAALAQALEIRRTTVSLEQYGKNAEDAKGTLSLSDSILGQVYNTLIEAKRLAIAGATDTQTPTSRQALAQQVDRILEELFQLANSKLRDKYIFAGQQVHQPAYARNLTGDIVYQGDRGVSLFEVGENDTVAVNVPGSETFGQVFDTLKKLRDNLLAGGSTDEIANDRIGELQDAMDRILQVRGQTGERVAHLERTQEKILRLQEEFSSWTDNLENVEIAKAVVDLKAQENAYQAVLASTSRLFQSSLLDFLR